MSRPGRWEIRTTDVPGELLVDGEMAGGAAPMPFPVPVREDRVTDEDLRLAEATLRYYAGGGVEEQTRAVCETLLNGGRRE